MTKRILIADDEIAIANMLAETLDQEGYATFKATQSLRFFDGVREHEPDLILLDFLMPYLNGGDELRLLRMTPETAHIPVIIVTAHPEVLEQEDELRKLGVVETLIKPVDINYLIRLIKRTIGEAQPARGVSR
ncbi:MAG TPA: response regulator [Ktedonobacterales bacterium]|jgi:CheY-like chemotaxis protein